jgi:hypothetical protein
VASTTPHLYRLPRKGGVPIFWVDHPVMSACGGLIINCGSDALLRAVCAALKRLGARRADYFLSNAFPILKLLFLTTTQQGSAHFGCEFQRISACGTSA